jgi:hypothetical protein
MHYVSPIKLSVFMQVLGIHRKHYAKNEYFSKRTLFSIIYLLQEHRLNPRNYSKHEIVMSNFVQSTYHDLHMHTKLQCINIYRYL